MKTKYFINSFFIFTFILVVLIYDGFAENTNKVETGDLQLNNSNPIEIGYVDWFRDFGQAVDISKKEDKPLLVLFQEVPGCSIASGYGKKVLTHPLIIETIENQFVPVAIYNNHDGQDKRILKSFNEPAWNNPVVRIITSDRFELAPRLSGDYSKLGLVNSMKTALNKSNKKIPAYLDILEQELAGKRNNSEKAVFAMHCFWTGEVKLGNIDGILSTNPGFMGGYEVVEVEYNPEIVSYEQLVKIAKINGVAKHLFAYDKDQKEIASKVLDNSFVSDIKSFKPDSEPKYYLSKTVYKYIPMTSLQASKVNSAIGNGKSPDHLLSEKQLQLLSYIKDNSSLDWTSCIGADIAKCWNEAIELTSRGTFSWN